MNCRHCEKELTHTFIDLGSAPPSNSYLTESDIRAPEKSYPLKVLVCSHCWLVQTEDFVGTDEMFTEDYAYFSSYSSSWLDHAKIYIDKMITRFQLNSQSNIVEIAANDGYLLQFVKEKNIPCYGIEPTHSTAMVAKEKGIEIIEEFFSDKKAKELVDQGRNADFMVANNVLAHVPDINDFLKGFATLLKTEGVATFEFPHLLNLVQFNQFDTIYHEHYSYLSLTAVQIIFEANGLSIFDVEELSTHGGSLRIYAQRNDTGKQPIRTAVNELKTREEKAGINTLEYYQGFQNKAEKIKTDLLNFLIQAKKDENNVAAYGAAAKGNTLMNFSGIRKDLLSYVVDKNPAKQGKYMPGSHIPILSTEELSKNRPDYLFILPWNIAEEIYNQNIELAKLGTQFIVTIPELRVID